MYSHVSSLPTWVLHQFTPLPFNQLQSILTINHCGPSQKSTSPVTHGLNSATQKQGLLWWRRGGGTFVMLISWPNLNDPDICWPTCVKPHIQFVPQIQKADKTLEAGKNVGVCACMCVWYLISLKTCAHKQQTRACDTSAQNIICKQKSILASEHFFSICKNAVPHPKLWQIWAWVSLRTRNNARSLVMSTFEALKGVGGIDSLLRWLVIWNTMTFDWLLGLITHSWKQTVSCKYQG